MKKIVLLFFALFLWFYAFMQPQANIDGYVFDQQTNEPIGGAKVKILGNSNYVATTDGNGHYEINGIQVDPGGTDYGFEVKKVGYETYSDTITLTPGTYGLEAVYLEKIKSSISGTVELVGGWGDVEDVVLDLILSGDTIASTHPDQDSSYQFLDLEPGNYTITANIENYVPQEESIELGESDQAIVDFLLLPIPGSISGHIIMEGGGDVTEVLVTISDTVAGKHPSDNGFYEFIEVPAGIYTIKAILNGYNSDPLSYPDTLLAPSDTIENLDFTMHPGFAKIFGYITNDEGGSIEGATIFAGTEEATSDAEGYYEIDNLPIGQISITVSATGYMDSNKDVELSGGDNQVDFVLLYRPEIIIVDVPPGGFDFGSVAVGDSSESSEFTVQGNHLDANLIVRSPFPFEISLDDLEFTHFILIENYESFVDTIVYVRFLPTVVTNYERVISLTSVGAEKKEVQVKGQGEEDSDKLHVEIVSPEEIICAGDSVLLTASVSGGSGSYTYEWKTDSIISTDSAVYVHPLEETKYTLTVIDTITGNSNSNQKSIQIYETVTIEDDPSDAAVCAGESVYFEVSLNIDENVTYQWQVNDSDIKDNSIYSGVNTDELTVTTVDSLNQGVFRCKVITQCNDVISESALLTVHRMPIDTLIVKGTPPTVLISPDSGLFYQWYKDNIKLPGQTGQFFYPPGEFEAGSEYYAVIENEFGCISTTNSYTASDQKNSFAVYPNPVSNILYIDLSTSNEKSNFKLSIRDLLGRTIVESIIPDGNIKKSLSLSTLKNGFYIVEIIDEKGSLLHSSKIIKN